MESALRLCAAMYGPGFFLFVDNLVTALVPQYEETLRELGAECLHSFKARVGFFHAGDIGDVF